MLKWQRNGLRPRLPKRYSLLAHLFLFSTGIHTSLLFLFFLLHDESPIILDLQKCNPDLPIILVPFVKSIPVNQQRTASGAVNQSSITSTVLKSKTIFKQEPTKKVAQKAKPKPKQVAKKETKKVAAKKQEAQKKEIKKTMQAKKETITDVASTSSFAPQFANDFDPDVLYVGRDDYDNLIRYQAAHEAITQHWQPPVGIPATTQCTLKIAIDKSGTVKDVDIVQSSQILVYDSAARRALTNTVFPKSFYNKTMIITFNQ